MQPQFAIIGGGVMGEVLSRAVTVSGLFAPEAVLVLDHNVNKLRKLQQEIGISVTSSLAEVAASPIILLAVKPDNAAKVLAELNQSPLAPDLLCISIMAGIPLDFMAHFFPAETALIRVMTNTPCQVQAGMSVLALNPYVTAAQTALTERIFGAVGECMVLPEKYLDAVTGLSGSGPGFVFLIVDALIEGGVLQGLPRATARELVLQTLIGSAKLMQQTDRHPAQLRDMVTSPGGTTIAGIQVMEEYKIRATLLKTVETATRRSAQLGQQNAARIHREGSAHAE